ncbi:MAG: helix-turn-helix domain-containing protein [Thermomicrobiales bacterium]
MIALHNLAQLARLSRDPAAALPIAEALTLARELGEASMVASGLTAMGHAMLDAGEPGRAATLFGESLDLAHDRGNVGDVIDALEGWARLGAETGQAVRAACIFGATGVLRDAVGVPYSPSDLAYFAPTMAALQTTLGDDGFADASARGRELSRDEALAEAVAIARGAEADAPSLEPSCLTRREREVLRLVVEGLSDKEIGAALTISAQTVTKHVGNVLRKLDVPSRTAAATLAVRRGLI